MVTLSAAGSTIALLLQAADPSLPITVIPDYLPPEIPIVTLPAVTPPIPFLYLPPPDTELPDSVRRLARQAFDNGDDTSWKSILTLARKTNPQAKPQIEAFEAELSAKRAEQLAQQARERADRLRAASPLDYWKGQIEVGGSRSTGNTDALALYSGVRFEREGLKITHLVSGRLDFQRSDGTTIADRLSLAWQPSYKIDDEASVYGLGQYERDRFIGFYSRFTASVGVGYALINNNEAKLTVQGGPAVRQINFVDRGWRTLGAGRAAMAFRWKLSPTLELTQDAALFVEGSSANATSTSAVDTKLIGALKARLSYNVQYERHNLIGTEPLDTTSRATLVYSF